jgi:hypothetical protein
MNERDRWDSRSVCCHLLYCRMGGYPRSSRGEVLSVHVTTGSSECRELRLGGVALRSGLFLGDMAVHLREGFSITMIRVRIMIITQNGRQRLTSLLQ